MQLPFDVLERSKQVEDIVMQGEKRLYYRFRFAEFYGGIVTADAVGCNLLCAYCWNYAKNETPEKAKGRFYSPEEVADKLDKLAKKHHVRQVRISGAEPFLGERSADHLIKVISLLKDVRVIVETNGILLGAIPGIVAKLALCRNLDHVRITIKGHDSTMFELATGANGAGLNYQLSAIENCKEYLVSHSVAAMPEIVDILKMRHTISKRIEIESLRYYPGTKKRMEERGML